MTRWFARSALCLALLILLGSTIAAAADAPACPPGAKPFSPELFDAAARQARDRGPLWRITRDGHSSYLYGTIHVGKAQWAAPGPLVKRALQQTDLLALELDPLDEAVQREMAAALAAKGPGKLPAALRARVKKFWEAACLPGDAAGQIPAEMQALTLTYMAASRDGFDPSYGSEILLSLIARSVGRPVVSLETVELQLKALFSQDDAEVEAMVRDWLDDLEADRLRPVLRKVAVVWETADLAELDNYQAWCECARTEGERKLMKRVLDDRNPGLAQSIHELHGEGRKLFAAVGAMHMVGPTGLPALMAARGYQVERLF
ncbi:TraB/GumN family protein [Polaromonas sp. LjRoot131]|uniref:TraB/GumN family protein n=1 Tax=Polaromonas sp. LjRoot131 TaxID=3342262 RepID=UPI003ECDAA0E